jgi:Flp pilus assembly pilin Flp
MKALVLKHGKGQTLIEYALITALVSLLLYENVISFLKTVAGKRGKI